MTAFDKAWKLAKEIKDGLAFVPTEQWETTKEDPLGDALDGARAKKRKPLELSGYVRTGSSDDKADDSPPMPVEKPFKMRKPGGCDHNFEVTDEDMVGDTLYRTYTCTKCGETMTSSPS